MKGHYQIRFMSEDDINSFIELCVEIDGESQFMLFEAQERNLYSENIKQQIHKAIHDNKSCIWVVENGNHDFVGYLMAVGNILRKTKHSVYVVIGILQEYSNQGIGTKLFKELFDWSNANHVHRIELTVSSENANAIKLYKKMGFAQEGIRRHSLKIGSEYMDEFHMAKVFE